MQINTSYTDWTPVSATTHARIWDGKVWRKDFSEAYYGGYQIKYVGINTRLGREWLQNFGHSTASCTPEVANMIDPKGTLRRAGMLFVAR